MVNNNIEWNEFDTYQRPSHARHLDWVFIEPRQGSMRNSIYRSKRKSKSIVWILLSLWRYLFWHSFDESNLLRKYGQSIVIDTAFVIELYTLPRKYNIGNSEVHIYYFDMYDYIFLFISSDMIDSIGYLFLYSSFTSIISTASIQVNK
jgi:hypothetical protein